MEWKNVRLWKDSLMGTPRVRVCGSEAWLPGEGSPSQPVRSPAPDAHFFHGKARCCICGSSPNSSSPSLSIYSGLSRASSPQSPVRQRQKQTEEETRKSSTKYQKRQKNTV